MTEQEAPKRKQGRVFLFLAGLFGLYLVALGAGALLVWQKPVKAAPKAPVAPVTAARALPANTLLLEGDLEGGVDARTRLVGRYAPRPLVIGQEVKRARAVPSFDAAPGALWVGWPAPRKAVEERLVDAALKAAVCIGERALGDVIVDAVVCPEGKGRSCIAFVRFDARTAASTTALVAPGAELRPACRMSPS